MKTFLKYLVCITALVVTTGTRAAQKELHRFLEFSGRVYATGLDAKTGEEFMDSALFIIVNEETLNRDTVMAGDNGEYYFRLPLDQQFMITITRKGFASKKLHADTHIPLFTKGKHSLEFELTLWRVIPGMDYSILDQPVAEIKYDHRHKSFDYDHVYTQLVNRELKKMYVTWYTKRTVVVVKTLKKPVAVKTKKAKRITLHW